MVSFWRRLNLNTKVVRCRKRLVAKFRVGEDQKMTGDAKE